MLDPNSSAAIWSAVAIIVAAVVAARASDIASRRQERRALTGSYVDLLTQTRGMLDDVAADVDECRAEVLRQRTVIGVLRRRIGVLRLALTGAGVPIPPDPEQADDH